MTGTSVAEPQHATLLARPAPGMDGRPNPFRLAADDSLAAAPALLVPPKRAMYHSLALSGWGQLDNGRPKKAALFFTVEAVCIAGFFYEQSRLANEDITGWDRDMVRSDRNTFVLYWLGTKVFSLLDAYVDAHLAGFDVDNITPPELNTPTPRPASLTFGLW